MPSALKRLDQFVDGAEYLLGHNLIEFDAIHLAAADPDTDWGDLSIVLTDDTGILQHSTYSTPNPWHGYCTDDNARAFILCNLLDELGGKVPGENLEDLASTYLAFIAACLNSDTGRFRNFMSHGRQWLEEDHLESRGSRNVGSWDCRWRQRKCIAA